MFIDNLYDFKESTEWEEMRESILAIMRISNATKTELEIMNFMLCKYAILVPCQEVDKSNLRLKGE